LLVRFFNPLDWWQQQQKTEAEDRYRQGWVLSTVVMQIPRYREWSYTVC